MIFILTHKNKFGGVNTWNKNICLLLNELNINYKIIDEKILYDTIQKNSILIINNYVHNLNNISNKIIELNLNIFFVVHSNICPSNQYLVENINYINNVIFVNEQIKNEIKQKLLTLKPTLNFFILNNYFCLSNANINLKNESLPNITIFNYIGRISPEKNLPMLFYALAGIKSDWLLNIYGNNSDERYFLILNDIIKKLCIDNKVRFNSFTDDKNIIYSNCNYVVLPSISEGSSFTVMESLSYGVPIIALKNIGDNNTHIKNNVNGYLIDINCEITNDNIYSNNYFDVLKKVGYVEVMLFKDYNNAGKFSFNQQRIMLPPNYCNVVREIFETNINIFKSVLLSAINNKMIFSPYTFSKKNSKSQLLYLLNKTTQYCIQ